MHSKLSGRILHSLAGLVAGVALLGTAGAQAGATQAGTRAGVRSNDLTVTKTIDTSSGALDR